ncbi:MAG TPA: SBBP repeat-containing protein [Thermoanaerobaculia bacterium]
MRNSNGHTPASHTRNALRHFIRRLVAVLFFLLIQHRIDAQMGPDEQRRAPAVAYAHLPLSFERNDGQVKADVRFLARGPGYTVLFKASEVILVPSARQGKPRVVRMRFLGAVGDGRTTGVDILPGTANYLVGSDRVRWHTNIPTYRRIRYEAVYPGIDIECYGDPQRLEYDFIVAPGSDPRRIELELDGGGDLRISAEGDLLIEGEASPLRVSRPRIYQEIDGVRLHVDGRYILTGRRTVGFQIGSYNERRPLVIDPVLIYSTYLPGSYSDLVSGVAVDASGNAYVVGTTSSPEESTWHGLPQYPRGNADVFVSKLNATGTALVYSVLFGGNRSDWGEAIAVDPQGHAYVTGYTQSADFPTLHAIQTTTGNGLQDSFVAKLNATGTDFEFSTYFGGQAPSRATAIALDGASNVFFVGVGSVPTSNSVFGTGNAFVAKLAANGAVLLYSSSLGGTGFQQALAVTVDPDRKVYVAGTTAAADFPTRNAVQPALAGETDGFVAKLTSAVEAVPLLTDGFEGENGDTTELGYTAFANWMVADGTADLIASDSPDFLPGSGPYTRLGGLAAIPSKIESKQEYRLSPMQSIFPAANPAFYRLRFSLGSAPAGPSGTGPVVTVRVGTAFAETFSLPDNAPRNTIVREFAVTSQTDARVSISLEGGAAALIDDVSLSRVVETPSISYSTYLGGGRADSVTGIVVDAAGAAYVTGRTASPDFPTNGARQPQFGGGPSDAFLAKLDPAGTAILYSSFIGGGGEDAAEGMARDTEGNLYLTGATASANFPTTKAMQGQLAGIWNAFVTKLTPAFELLYSTYLGGSYIDFAYTIAVDGQGNAYVGGQANSTDFPTENALFPGHGGDADGFIAKLLDAPDVRLIGLTPTRGGNAGTVTVMIRGINFPPGAVSVELVAHTREDIAAISAAVIDVTHIRAIFDLQGKPPGTRDLVVSFSDGTVVKLAAAFTVEPGGGAEVWIDVIGPNRVRGGVPTKYFLVVGNRGNVDAIGVPVTLHGLPENGHVRLDFAVGKIPGGLDPAIAQLPLDVQTATDRAVPLFLPLIPPGSTLTLPLIITPSAGGSFALQAKLDDAYFMSRARDILAATPSTANCINGVAKILGDVVALIPGPGCVEVLFEGLMNIYRESAVEAIAEVGRSFGSPSSPKSVNQIILEAAVEAGAACGRSVFPPALLIQLGILAGDAFKTWEACAKMLDRLTDPFDVSVVFAVDPNAKIGPQGSGTGRYVSGTQPLRYAVYFENLETATAPASTVVIEDHLDATTLDFDTLELGPISFGNVQVTPPPGSASFESIVDLRPNTNLLVQVIAGLDRGEGILRWRLMSIDPATGQPPIDPDAGFLPPNINPPEGDGSVFFTVSPKQAITIGTYVPNHATIIFDTNAPIDTGVWSNRLDMEPPMSQVGPIESPQCGPEVAVQWSGSDTGSGVLDYAIYVSEDGGIFEPWLWHIQQTSEMFLGTYGHTYAFSSIARDQTGNRERTPASADAVVTLIDTVPPRVVCPEGLSIPAATPAGATATFTATATDNCGAATFTCSPMSGSIFAIGTSVVECLAADAVGNAGACRFPVHIEGATEQISHLISRIRDENLLPGIKNSLLAKLAALSNIGTAAACAALAAFLNEVNAQAGKQIPQELATDFIRMAKQIRRVMACAPDDAD